MHILGKWEPKIIYFNFINRTSFHKKWNPDTVDFNKKRILQRYLLIYLLFMDLNYNRFFHIISGFKRNVRNFTSERLQFQSFIRPKIGINVMSNWRDLNSTRHTNSRGWWLFRFQSHPGRVSNLGSLIIDGLSHL